MSDFASSCVATAHRLLEGPQSVHVDEHAKRQAVGDLRIAEAERLYLLCSLDQARPFCVFVHQVQTLNDTLDFIFSKLPATSFSTSNRSAYALGVATQDCPDWRCFDRRQSVGSLLRSFERVTLLMLPVEKVKQAQIAVEDNLSAAASATASTATATSSSSGIGSNRRADAAEGMDVGEIVYEKGDKALYMGEQVCLILEKHMDDYPNLYYTVRLLHEDRDKQTIPSKLSHRLRKFTGEGALHFRIQWAKCVFNIDGVHPDMSVSDLRSHVEVTAAHTGYHPTLKMSPSAQLVCRGRRLPQERSEVTVRDLGIKQGSLIVVEDR